MKSWVDEDGDGIHVSTISKIEKAVSTEEDDDMLRKKEIVPYCTKVCL